MNGWGMGLGLIVWVALLVLIIAGVLWFVLSPTTTSGGEERRSSGEERRSSGIDVLNERYEQQSVMLSKGEAASDRPGRHLYGFESRAVNRIAQSSIREIPNLVQPPPDAKPEVA